VDVDLGETPPNKHYNNTFTMMGTTTPWPDPRVLDILMGTTDDLDETPPQLDLKEIGEITPG
jgi:hypothetical protein